MTLHMNMMQRASGPLQGIGQVGNDLVHDHHPCAYQPVMNPPEIWKGHDWAQGMRQQPPKGLYRNMVAGRQGLDHVELHLWEKSLKVSTWIQTTTRTMHL